MTEVSQYYVLAIKKVSIIQSCIKKNVTSTWREMITLFSQHQ